MWGLRPCHRTDDYRYFRPISEFAAGREPGMTGVWTVSPQGAGQNSRHWRSHQPMGNIARLRVKRHTDLDYFRYIVPCGLTKPVTSMRQLGVDVPAQDVIERLRRHFEQIFDLQ